MAEVTNTQNHVNVEVQPQNLNVKILPSFAVTLFDLSMESSVNNSITF
jgi:hypothetical protein